MKKLDDQQLGRLENKILQLLNKHFQPIEKEEVKKHLCYGFGIRLRMMMKSRWFIHNKIDEHDKNKALEGFVLNEMDIHLNSYYLNLKGSLDNIAWAINYFYQLQDTIDESIAASRFYTNLFGSDFLRDLNEHEPRMVNEIKKYDEWSKEIKEFRDPAAHRIPLQFIAGFINEKHRMKIKELEKEAESFFQKGAALNDSWEIEDMEESTELFSQGFSKLTESRRIGNYIPIFISRGDNKQTIRYLPNQLGRDHSYFLLLNDFLLNGLAKNT